MAQPLNPYKEQIREQADKWGLDLDLVLSLATQENQPYDPNAVSNKGAVGLFQIMPGTAGDPGYNQSPYPADKSLSDPQANIEFGVERLYRMLVNFDGVIPHALAAYNAGPGKTGEWLAGGGEKKNLPAETRKYIDDITQRYKDTTIGRVLNMDKPDPMEQPLMAATEPEPLNLEQYNTDPNPDTMEPLDLDMQAKPIYPVPDAVSTPKPAASNLWGRDNKPTAAKTALSAVATRPPDAEIPEGLDWWTNQADWAAKALYTSVVDMSAMVVDMADFGFGQDDVTDKFAAYIRQHTDDVRESIAPWIRKDLENEIIGRDENGELDFNMPNLRQVANLIFESAAPSGAIVGGGMKLLKGMQKIKKLQAAVKASPKLASGVAFGAANSAYVTTETYQSVYADVLEQARKDDIPLGQAHEEAARAASVAAYIMAPLSAFTGAMGEGMAAVGKTWTKRLAKGIVYGSLSEAPEEGGQSLAEQVGKGEELDYVRAANAAALGALGAGVTEGVMAAGWGDRTSELPYLPGEEPPPNDNIAAGLNAGAAGLPNIPTPLMPDASETGIPYANIPPYEPPGGPPATPPLASPGFLSTLAQAAAQSTSDTEIDEPDTTSPGYQAALAQVQSAEESLRRRVEPAPEPVPEPEPVPAPEPVPEDFVSDAAALGQPAPEPTPDPQRLASARRRVFGQVSNMMGTPGVAYVDMFRQQLARAVDGEGSVGAGTLASLSADELVQLARLTLDDVRTSGSDMSVRDTFDTSFAEVVQHINNGWLGGNLTHIEPTQEQSQEDILAQLVDESTPEPMSGEALAATFVEAYMENQDPGADANRRRDMRGILHANIGTRNGQEAYDEVALRYAGNTGNTGIAAGLTAMRDAMDAHAQAPAVQPAQVQAQTVTQERLDALIDTAWELHSELDGQMTEQAFRQRAQRLTPTDTETRIRNSLERWATAIPGMDASARRNAREELEGRISELGTTPEEQAEARTARQEEIRRTAELGVIKDEAARDFRNRVNEAAGREITGEEHDLVFNMSRGVLNNDYRSVLGDFHLVDGQAMPIVPRNNRAEAAQKYLDIIEAKKELDAGDFTVESRVFDPNGVSETSNYNLDLSVSDEFRRRGLPVPEELPKGRQYTARWFIKPKPNSALSKVVDTDKVVGRMSYSVAREQRTEENAGRALVTVAHVPSVSGMNSAIPRHMGHGAAAMLDGVKDLLRQDAVVYGDSDVSRNASSVPGFAREQGFDVELNPEGVQNENAAVGDYGMFRGPGWAFRLSSLPLGGQPSMVERRMPGEESRNRALSMLERTQPVDAADRSPMTPETPRQTDIRTGRTVKIAVTPKMAAALQELPGFKDYIATVEEGATAELAGVVDEYFDNNPAGDTMEELTPDGAVRLREHVARTAPGTSYADWTFLNTLPLLHGLEVASGASRAKLVPIPVSMWSAISPMLTSESVPQESKLALKGLQKRIARVQPQYTAGGPLTQQAAAAQPAPQDTVLPERDRSGQMQLNLEGAEDFNPLTGKKYTEVQRKKRDKEIKDAADTQRQVDEWEAQNAWRRDPDTQGIEAENTAAELDLKDIEEAGGRDALPDARRVDRTANNAEHAEAVTAYLHGQVGASESDAYWHDRNNGGDGGGGNGSNPPTDGGDGGASRRGISTIGKFKKRWQDLKKKHWDNWVRDYQDAQIAIERAQKILAAKNGLLSDRFQAHEGWTRVPSAIVDKIDRMFASHIEPIVNIAQGKTKEGNVVEGWKDIGSEDLNKFLAALHSRPRNVFVAKHRGAVPPTGDVAGGSGVSDNVASSTVAELEARYGADQLAALEDQVFNLSQLLRDTLAPKTLANTNGTGLLGREQMDNWNPDMEFLAEYREVRDKYGYADAFKPENYADVDSGTMDVATWNEKMHQITYVPLFDVAPEATLGSALQNVQWAREDFSSPASLFGHELQAAQGRGPDRGLAKDALPHLIANMQIAITRGTRNRSLARRVVNLIQGINDDRIGVVLKMEDGSEYPAGTFNKGAFLDAQIKKHWPRDMPETAFPPGSSPPVIRFKNGDTEVAAIIYDPRLAEALMTRQTPSAPGKIMKTFLMASSFVRRSMTTLSTDFIASNVFREGINARIQAMSIPGLDDTARKQIAKLVNPKSVTIWSMDYWHDTKRPNVDYENETLDNGEPNPDYEPDEEKREMRTIIRDLKRAGMPSLLYRSFDPVEIKEEMTRKLDAVRNATTKKGRAKAYADMVREFADRVEDVANATENGVRALVASGVYKEFMAKGRAHAMENVPGFPEWSQQRQKDFMRQTYHEASINHAANAGQNLSVNFQRFGAKTRGINRYFFFLNATIQGSSRVLKQGGAGRLARIGVKLAAANATLTVLNNMWGGDDDDGRKLYELHVPQWVREHNMVLMLPQFAGGKGEYISMPMPYGFNFFSGFGEAVVSSVMTAETRNMTIGESMWDMPGKMMGLAMNSFTPVPSSVAENPFRLLVPHMLKPAYDQAINKDWRGIPIVPPGASYLTSAAAPPDSMNVRDPDPDGSLEWLTRSATRGLNSIFGNEYKSGGVLDINPNTLEHLFKSYMGGAGMLPFRTYDSVVHAIGGDMTDMASGAPVVRRFFGLGESRFDDRERYNNLRDELLRVHSERIGLASERSTNPDAYASFMATEGDLYSSGVVGRLLATEKQVRKLSRIRNKIRRVSSKTQGQRDRMESLDQRITDIEVRFNKYYYEALVEEKF